MLPKAARLTTSEVAEVLAKGVSVSLLPTSGQKSLISAKFLAKAGTFKAAAVAPKSLAKSAVARNRLRRAVYRALASLPTLKKGGYMVIFVRIIPKSPLTLAFTPEIKAILEKISSS